MFCQDQEHQKDTTIDLQIAKHFKMSSLKRKYSTCSTASTNPPKKQKQQPSTDKPHANSITIPERYKTDITDNGKGVYELKLSIASLNGLQRIAWGLDLRAESVSVFLKYPDGNGKDYVSFCVHASTDNEEDNEERNLRHSYCSIKGSDPIMTPCSPRSTILTCVLSRELYGLTALRHCRDPVVIYDKAL